MNKSRNEAAERVSGTSTVLDGEVSNLTVLEFKERLWTLSYMRNNSIKTTLLLFEPDLPINEVVERAKEYCKTKSVNFTWIEKSIVDLSLREMKEKE